MQDIASWLAQVGLGQYAQRFAENEIDVSVLRHLSDQDLKDIGIPLGHRRKVLAAIGELTSTAPAASEVVAPTEPKPADAAERRQVTVMFVDLVGSTGLSARMDLEDLREIVSSYQKSVTETIRRYDGFVAKYMGDGVLVYFGYPQAHEDDAERAVRAGLDLIKGVTALKAPCLLQVRVGIATGLVVVGDLVGSGEAQERGVIGETPNLAARLQGIAAPNMVVLADDTRRLVGNLFKLRDLGGHELKGMAGPVRAWAAVAPSEAESRFEALHAGGLSALVGREEELELLLRRWSRAKSGEGQVVLLSGEAGIGKSRLTAALLEELAGEPHARLRYFCSPQHTDSALYPVISQMMRDAGFAHDDSPQVKKGKLDALLVQTLTSPQEAALLAQMLSLPSDGAYPVLELEPQLRRQKTLEALGSRLEALTRVNPVLMIFEDAHWIDPTSLELLGRAVDLAVSKHLLILVTFRPEFSPPWIGRPHVTALTLNRLTRRDIDALIGQVVGNKSLPTNIRHDIVERTDGVPLFVEEMTKAVLDAEDESDMRRAAGNVPSPTMAVPASLHASLMARLDRLGAAKEVAQIGAAIGREFSHVLLAAIVDRPQAELSSALDRLIAAGLLFRQGVPPHASYLFKHALVQDAAYGMLLREPRRALHARIATILESEFIEIGENQPELLARHYTSAELIEKAAAFWGKAGQRSLERSALVEAAEQLGNALAQIAILPTTPSWRREQIKLQVALMNALMQVKGYASPETKTAAEKARAMIEQAEALGEASDDPLLLFSALYGQWVTNFIDFRGDMAREVAAQVLALGKGQGRSTQLMLGHRFMAATLMFLGDVAPAKSHYDDALALYDPAERDRLAARFGQDNRVTNLAFRSVALWVLGYPKSALDDVDCALREAREFGHAATLMLALNFAIMTNTLCGNYQTSNRSIEELTVLAQEKNAPFRKAEAVFRRGCVLALTGQAQSAVDTIKSGIEMWRSTGSTLFTPAHLFMLATACADVGHFEHAWCCIDEAMTAMDESLEKLYEAEVHRIAGEIALKQPQRDVVKAQAYFEHALVIARAQQAKSWELRAAMSMARLLSEQGKRHVARDLLAPVYDWFTEGFDTRDLREAKVLLGELC